MLRHQQPPRTVPTSWSAAREVVMHAHPPVRCFEHRGPISLVAALAIAACADAPNEPDAPLFSHGGAHAISGAVLGPDGTSICGFLPAGSRVTVRVLNPVAAPLIVAIQRPTCPSNSFSFSVAPGTYRLQVALDGTLGALPLRYLEPGDVVVEGGDVTRDVQVREGLPFGGSATLDGAPLPGVPLTLVYDFLANLVAAPGVSGADGAWDDVGPPARSPMRVQAGVRYRVSGWECPALGTRALVQPPSSFLFPSETGGVDCTMETAPAVEFTHHRTRAVVTALAANVGGAQDFGQYGRGWGVQFPVDPPTGPRHTPAAATHLFNGGLLIGLEPDVVLAGLDVGGYGLECGGACRDLGQDATVKVVTSGSDGTVIRWTYTDAPSADGVGFKIVQHSFDGKPPADYVLFQYSITNQSRTTRTFFAGFFGDWDVAGNAQDDIGFTELDRRLMYMTNTAGGIHVGTLLLGHFLISGNFFFNGNDVNGANPLSLGDQLRALTGDLRRMSIGPADNRVIHAVGPITLKRGKTAIVWMAVVAGEDRAQLLAHATAAAAHVGQAIAQAPFQGTVSSTSLDFGETLVVQPSPSLPWDGDEFVRFGESSSSFVVESGVDAITVVVPRLPTGPMDLLIYNQGTEQRTEALPVTIASTFDPIGQDRITTAPDVTAGPFPMSFFIELSNDDPDHFVTVAPSADLALTVKIEWQTSADVDLLWRNHDATGYEGNFDGATSANPEQTSVTVPAGATWRLQFNKWDTVSPPTLARVTITSP
jgi:hypothetical protein